MKKNLPLCKMDVKIKLPDHLTRMMGSFSFDNQFITYTADGIDMNGFRIKFQLFT
jgi:hypothetical protein